MRILQVIPYFHWSYGGPVRAVYEVSKELAARGHKVTIYTTDVGRGRSLKENEKIKLDDVNIYYFKCDSNWVADKLKIHISFEMQNAMKKNLRDFDIVHLQECRGMQNFYAWYYANKYHVPYILQGHGSAPSCLSGQKLDRTLTKFFFDSLIGIKILKNASRVIALNATEKKQYTALGVDNSRIEIIGNGINLDEFSDLPPKGEFKLKHGIDPEFKLLLFLGRINEIKGVDILIEAFADLSKIYDKLVLIIAGPDDGFLSSVNREIDYYDLSNRIILTGPLYATDKLRAYVDADIFILPSRYECFAISMLEACSCGLPVIVTCNCGMSDLVKEKKLGYVIRGCKEELVSSVIKLMDSEKLRLFFGNQGKKLVQEELNWINIISDYEKIIKKILEND